MKTYISLLRGINVGGHKKILMKDLKALYESLGFQSVVTYIQSGNVVFQSEFSPKTLKSKIENAIKETYSFDVVSFIETPESITKIINNNPFLKDPKLDVKRMYFAILDRSPNDYSNLENAIYGPEKITTWKHVIYLYYPEGVGKSKLSNNFIESKLNLNATSRNLNTMKKLETLVS